MDESSKFAGTRLSEGIRRGYGVARTERARFCQNRLSTRISGYTVALRSTQGGEIRRRARRRWVHSGPDEDEITEERRGGASLPAECVRVARWPVHYHNRIPLCGP